MKLKTQELKGPALDYAVAVCEGKEDWIDDIDELFPFEPSELWSQAGPIIERESISLDRDIVSGEWIANGFMYGDTPLVAAMRAYVYVRQDSEIEVPEELTKG